MKTVIKEHSILFAGPMVRAILQGQKTQTRRVIKPLCGASPHFHIKEGDRYPYYYRRRDAVWDSFGTAEELAAKHCPYGKPGDHLWVREPWFEYQGVYYFAATDNDRLRAEFRQRPDLKQRLRWRSPIHMTRSYSRITLEILSVRVERLQSISEEDALSGGLEEKFFLSQPCWRGDPEGEWCRHPVDAYKNLWDSLDRKNPWASNPWVWVIQFQKVEG